MTDEKWNALLSALENTADMKQAIKAAKVISKSAGAAHVSDLYRLLNSDQQFVREVAAYPLTRLEGLRALPKLFEAMSLADSLGQDNDGMSNAVLELVESDKKHSAPLLLALLKNEVPSVRADAAWAIGFVADEINPAILFDLAAGDPDPEVRSIAADSLQAYIGKGLRSPFDTSAFTGKWMWLDCAAELHYGFDLSGAQAICIKSNAYTYNVGDIMLRIALSTKSVFTGEQIFTNGAWYPVTGTLEKEKLHLQGAGLDWWMEKVT